MAVLAIAHNPHRHRRADNAGHWTDSAVVMTGTVFDLAAFGQFSCSHCILSPTFQHDRSDDRALHRPAHARPCNRRAGVKEHSPPHARNSSFGQAYPFENRLRREVGGVCFAVGGLDVLPVDEPGESTTYRGIAMSRWRPLDLTGLAACIDDRISE